MADFTRGLQWAGTAVKMGQYLPTLRVEEADVQRAPTYGQPDRKRDHVSTTPYGSSSHALSNTNTSVHCGTHQPTHKSLPNSQLLGLANVRVEHPEVSLSQHMTWHQLNRDRGSHRLTRCDVF